MLRLKRFSRHLSLLLAWIIACAPVLPAFAMAQASAEAHTAHHAPAVAKADVKSHCVEHQGEQNPCCVYCNLHFTGIHAFSYPLSYSQPLQFPLIPRLHSQWIAAGQDRPPSA